MNAESNGSPAKHANHAKLGAGDLKTEPVTVSNPVPESALKPMPLMQTVEDALALCDQQRGDNFYLTAFMLQAWLGQLLVDTGVEYSEKKDPRERVLQNGQAWRVFRELFHATTAGEFRDIFASLLRLAEYDDPLASLLRCALVPFAIELKCSSSSEPSSILHSPSSHSSFSVLPSSLASRPSSTLRPPSSRSHSSLSILQSSLSRLCAWLDAAVHWQTHEHWHLAPVCLDPDPENRELALLGTTQRHFVRLDSPAKARWHWQFSDAAERFNGSVKWPVLGQAMSSESDRVWPYRQVDGLIIALWPLVTRHNWTYCDLLNVIRQASGPALHDSTTPPLRSSSYPCDREQSLATHCVNALGLRKTGNGKTAKDGKPAGWEVVGKIIKAKG